MAMSLVLPARRPMRAADLAHLPDDGRRYELLDGQLLVSPAPTSAHQLCVTGLLRILAASLPEDLVALPAPCDWRVAAATVVQPDCLVVRRSEVGGAVLTRTPLLVVEVLSPSTRLTDLGSKRLLYERAGVAAYWQLDPDSPELVCLERVGTELVVAAHGSGDTVVSVRRPARIHLIPSRIAAGG